MGVLLVRHADAVQGGAGVDDAGRWLSAYGRARARTTAEALKQKGLHFERFVTSPRVRAVQTAEIFALVAGFGGVVETLASLSYTVPASHALRDLSALTGNVVAFGHMPTIAELAQLMCTNQVSLSFAPCEAAWIDQGKLVWTLDLSSAE